MNIQQNIETELRHFLLDLLFTDYMTFKQLDDSEGHIILNTSLPHYIENFFKELPIGDNIDFYLFEYIHITKDDEHINIEVNSIYEFKNLEYKYNEDYDDSDDSDDELIFYAVDKPVYFYIIFEKYKLSYIEMYVDTDEIREEWEIWPDNQVPHSFEKYAYEVQQ